MRDKVIARKNGRCEKNRWEYGYDNLEALDDIINKPPFDHCPAHVGGNFDERCMKGLIVARLVSNANYENLLMTYDQEIKRTMNSESIDNYHKVREYLSYNSIVS